MPEKTFRAILHVLRVGPHEANHPGLDNAFALFQYVSVFCHGTTTAYFLFMWVLVYIHLHRIHNSSLFDELGLHSCAETTPGRSRDCGCNSSTVTGGKYLAGTSRIDGRLSR